MAQSKVTLNEIMKAVRELTFDRFIIPAFAIKQIGSGNFIEIDPSFEPEISDPNVEPVKGKLTLYKVAEGETEESSKEIIVEIIFHECPTMEDVMDKLIEEGIIVAYTPYFRGQEPANSLIKVNKELTEDFTAFRRYFFSDSEIVEMIRWYYAKVLDICDKEINDELIGKLKRPSEKHLAIWVSYYLVDKRRLYENAANAIGQTFTDGSDYTGSDGNSSPTSTTVQIGSVFTVTEDTSQGYFYLSLIHI